MPARPTLTAAILGAGLMGRWHAQASKHAGGRLAWVVDPRLQAASRLASRYGAARVAVDPQEVLSDPAVDVVHVCAPPETHAALARHALELGKHVLVEKPLAPTATATASILQLASDAGAVVVPVHQLLFQRGMLALQRSLGGLGSLCHLEVTVCSAGAADDTEAARDTLVAEILSHPMSLFERLAPGTLEHCRWQVTRPRAGELRALAGYDGLSLGVLVSAAGRPTRHLLRAIGDSASIDVDLFHGFAVRRPGAVSWARKLTAPFRDSGVTLAVAFGNLARRGLAREAAYPGLRELVRRTYRSIREATPPPISAAETLAAARGRDQVLEAAGLTARVP